MTFTTVLVKATIKFILNHKRLGISNVIFGRGEGFCVCGGKRESSWKHHSTCFKENYKVIIIKLSLALQLKKTYACINGTK